MEHQIQQPVQIHSTVEVVMKFMQDTRSLDTLDESIHTLKSKTISIDHRLNLLDLLSKKRPLTPEEQSEQENLQSKASFYDLQTCILYNLERIREKITKLNKSNLTN
jgi:uncharacterized protein YnzC (UPF0291/DUF896 family)